MEYLSDTKYSMFALVEIRCMHGNEEPENTSISTHIFVVNMHNSCNIRRIFRCMEQKQLPQDIYSYIDEVQQSISFK